MLSPIRIILDHVRCALFHFVFGLLEYPTGIYPTELHLESPPTPSYCLALHHEKVRNYMVKEIEQILCHTQ